MLEAMQPHHSAAARYIDNEEYMTAVSPPPLGGWQATVNDDFAIPQRPARCLDGYIN